MNCSDRLHCPKSLVCSIKLPVFSTLRVPLFSRLALVPAFNIPFGVSSGDAGRLKCNARKARRICVMCLVRDSIPMETKCESDEDGSEFIEVVVIGSRKESIMESCLDSPFRSLPLRFWSISRDSSVDLVLLQRLNQEGPFFKSEF
ncbi:hypothetical protein AALP_AA2G191800 [Arabis alpina]|uniref:Uncharacterized protein n=1 Tax=Arabis alpina TaxID=50452 RepID=A0A087HII9_ARAAL|nr:hypothetical protein AALP_AA2G191800 [Arabis alpina]